jgi:hypothetical protein
MKHTKTAKTTLDPDLAKRALDADMGNALKAINNGQLLPKYRREQLEAIAAGRPSPSSTTFAANYAGLAAALGCTRQRLAYWTRQPDAPQPRQDGRHDVAEWRAYLAARGRLPAAAGTPQPDTTATAQAPQDGRPRTRLDYADGVEGLLARAGERLPRMMQVALEAAGLKPTPSQLDQMTVSLYLLQAGQADHLCRLWGFPSVFEPDENGEGPYPPAIQKAAARVANDPRTGRDLAPPSDKAPVIKVPVIES